MPPQLRMRVERRRQLGAWSCRFGTVAGGHEDGWWVILCENGKKQLVTYFRPSKGRAYAEAYLDDMTEEWLNSQPLPIGPV